MKICVRVIRELGIKRTEILYLSRNPSRCVLQVSGNAAGREVQVPWNGIQGRTKRLIHGLVKQMQFCVSFIALW